MLIFDGTINLNELVKHVCDQTNLDATQSGRECATNSDEIRAFLGINHIMSISKLPNVTCYWSVESYLSTWCKKRNDKKSFHKNSSKFTQLINLTKLITHIVINDLNKAFQDAMSDAERQSIDEQIQKSNFL